MSFEVESAQVLALAAEVLQAPTPDERRDAAEGLKVRVLRLPGAFPGEKVQQLLRRLLADRDLGDHRDGEGNPLRRSFVAANQALGFPWALEVDPTDLKHLDLPPPASQPGTIPAGFAFAAALVSCLFSGFTSLIGLFRLSGIPSFALGTIGLIGLGHAVGTMAVLASHGPEHSQVAVRQLRWLSRAWLPIPILALVLALASGQSIDGSVLLGAALTSAPAFVTAALSALTARRLAKAAPPP